MIASAGVAAAGFLPWSRTGRSGRSRSGIELARALREVGLAPGGWRGLLFVLFLFTPLLAAGVWIAALTGRRLLVALLGAAAGGLGVAAALLLRDSTLRVEKAVDAALAAGILAIAGAAVLAFLTSDEEGDR